MVTLLRTLAADLFKLKRGAALRIVLILPLCFALLDFLLLGWPLIHTTSALKPAALNDLPFKMVLLFWVGLFHPLLLAVLPALLVGPEHRARAWKHLRAQPVRPWMLYLSKLLLLWVLTAATLVVVGLALRIEWAILVKLQPLLYIPFPGKPIAQMLAWLWLGSLPLLTLYLWVAHRVNSAGVTIMFALVGLILTVSLSGQSQITAWKRDFIPWLLPYACAEHPITNPKKEQRAHAAGEPYRVRYEVLQTPDGRLIRNWALEPPQPTSGWALATFSLGLAMGLAVLGLFDARYQAT